MRKLITAAALATMSIGANAQNPIVQTWFTTDPAPMVSGDRLYVYTGHDEDNATFFWMNEWRVYSTSDMVNWTDHGSPLNLESFSWADDRAWAPQCVERNGKFYLYIPAHDKNTGTMAIGVGVSNKPTGPFKDPIGKPLATGSWDYIDPTVLIDDDGKAYLAWGNPRIYICELNDDMISIKGGEQAIKKLDMTEEAFGAPPRNERKEGVKYTEGYVEGPWLSKRNGKYYLLYASGGIPEHISYSTADNIYGPWKFGSSIMPVCDTRSFTNHSGVVDYKGHSYFFYHTGKLPNGGGFGRSVAVEEFKYNADGSFPVIMPTDEGVKPIGTLNPFQRVEAETMAFSRGLKSEDNAKTGVYISEIHHHDSLVVKCVDFGTRQPKKFTASVASALQGGKMEIHLDKADGPILCTIECGGTGGWEAWRKVSAPITQTVTGKHDLIFQFRGLSGQRLFNFDWWKME